MATATIQMSVSPTQAETELVQSRSVGYRLLDDKGKKMRKFMPTGKKPKVLVLADGLSLRVRSSGSFRAQDIEHPKGEGIFSLIWEALAKKPGSICEKQVTDIQDAKAASLEMIEINLELGSKK